MIDNTEWEIWCDVSVPEPGSASYLAQGSASRVGVAVKKVESSKRSKWNGVLKQYRRLGVRIAPLVLETTGFMGSDFSDFLTTVESVSEGPSRTDLISQLSVTLAKCNVECVREAGRKACEVNEF